ncbi:MAG: SDR family NAD(P)-dependent oxidoreductase [Acidimicrobiaceae bacterium]|nr:SDR family NAD(P)-dependent oxidoreductase [Acidimicrobiaceae bacterium]
MSRVAVVTGAAGAIGSAVCRRLGESGDAVVGLDAADGAVAGAVEAIACDISDAGSVAAAFDAIRDRHGHPAVLVNSAGITGAGGVEDESPEDWRRILDVNLTGAYLCARQAIAGMRAAGGGRIVNVASVNGRFGGSPLSGPAYAASKGGLITLTRFLALHHAADNIAVNAVAPGPHDTPMWQALDPAWRERILATVPGDAPGDPDDLAATVAFLCGPHAGYITGATIDINGGQWMG